MTGVRLRCACGGGGQLESRGSGPDPTPLVTAAVDARVAWLAERFAERDLFVATEKKRAASLQQLRTANRQVKDALRLVIASRPAADAAGSRAVADNKVPSGPRLFKGTAR